VFAPVYKVYANFYGVHYHYIRPSFRDYNDRFTKEQTSAKYTLKTDGERSQP
jgi:hypothetical protein